MLAHSVSQKFSEKQISERESDHHESDIQCHIATGQGFGIKFGSVNLTAWWSWSFILIWLWSLLWKQGSNLVRMKTWPETWSEVRSTNPGPYKHRRAYIKTTVKMPKLSFLMAPQNPWFRFYINIWDIKSMMLNVCMYVCMMQNWSPTSVCSMLIPQNPWFRFHINIWDINSMIIRCKTDLLLPIS